MLPMELQKKVIADYEDGMPVPPISQVQTLLRNVLPGALKGDSFLRYMQDDPVPTLYDHDLVILDKLR